MVIKNDSQGTIKGNMYSLSAEECISESEDKINQQVFNTEFVIFPINCSR